MPDSQVHTSLSVTLLTIFISKFRDMMWFLLKYFSLDIPEGEIDWLISQRITVLSSIKPVISSKQTVKVTF